MQDVGLKRKNNNWKDFFPHDNRYFETDNGILYCGDNVDVLRQIADNVIDTVITDPPYGLKFMGKKWDYDVPSIETWQEVLRVIKPGATLLSFAGSRTQHRMAVNVEDAGFILKDTLMWIYSTGFPKATDISKQIAKKQGAKKQGAKKQGTGSRGNTFHLSDAYQDYELTEDAKLWDGWKSHSLKPAYEPIIMAIKQNEGSYAENALKWGVAGLNIKSARIEPRNEQDLKDLRSKRPSKTSNANSYSLHHGGLSGMDRSNRQHIQGRFPTNILLDEESAKILDERSVSISRFFYVAKASKSERGDDNIHPTVKPLKLIEYLIRLTIMPNSNQIYFDPFMGSGTTAVACEKLNRMWIGIELNEKYCEIVKNRLRPVTKIKRLF